TSANPARDPRPPRSRCAFRRRAFELPASTRRARNLAAPLYRLRHRQRRRARTSRTGRQSRGRQPRPARPGSRRRPPPPSRLPRRRTLLRRLHLARLGRAGLTTDNVRAPGRCVSNGWEADVASLRLEASIHGVPLFTLMRKLGRAALCGLHGGEELTVLVLVEAALLSVDDLLSS